jgi:hypothetical protein
VLAPCVEQTAGESVMELHQTTSHTRTRACSSAACGPVAYSRALERQFYVVLKSVPESSVKRLTMFHSGPAINAYAILFMHPTPAGMAELADAADSKSADPCGHGGSTPPPGTSSNFLRISRMPFCQICDRNVPGLCQISHIGMAPVPFLRQGLPFSPAYFRAPPELLPTLGLSKKLVAASGQ